MVSTINIFHLKPFGPNCQSVPPETIFIPQVAITVLPLNVAYSVLGRWIFGSVTCKIWLTADVLCCTASILNLCAIAMDR